MVAAARARPAFEAADGGGAALAADAAGLGADQCGDGRHAVIRPARPRGRLRDRLWRGVARLHAAAARAVCGVWRNALAAAGHAERARGRVAHVGDGPGATRAHGAVPLALPRPPVPLLGHEGAGGGGARRRGQRRADRARAVGGGAQGVRGVRRPPAGADRHHRHHRRRRRARRRRRRRGRRAARRGQCRGGGAGRRRAARAAAAGAGRARRDGHVKGAGRLLQRHPGRDGQRRSAAVQGVAAANGATWLASHLISQPARPSPSLSSALPPDENACPSPPGVPGRRDLRAVRRRRRLARPQRGVLPHADPLLVE
jgi:hypothetical protein